MTSLPHDHGPSSRHTLEHMPKSEDFLIISDLFKQLADPTRIRIFWLLCHCEECVLNISAITGMSSPAVSHHLRILREAGLLVSRSDGKEVYYCAADTARSRELHAAAERLLQLEGCPLHGGE